MKRTLFSLLWITASVAQVAGDPPKAVDDRLVVELVAKEPEIRTPTALDVDSKGRVWVLENNTHFRPKNYDAPPTDRVLVFDDFGPDGHARKQTVFAEGFKNGMGLRLLPDGGVIVATRGEIFRLRDTDGDGRADDRVTLLKLNSTADYPHDGLSGMALDRAGHLFVGLGENFGIPWILTGSDGSEVRGADEGGIFRCNLEGAQLERWALGLWNPFGLVVDQEGRLFALDNDPGAGSFCRLLYIVQHGDYGYRYRYGRTVDHPFLSWFGQIPGTLPPVSLVGEAPTGIIQYRGITVPYEYDGQLLGCTWSDHGIQRFPLEKSGASYSTKPEWLVRGGNDFRPSGIAEAPDGSLLIGDWVDGSYEVHGKGRIWRVRSQGKAGAPVAPKEPGAGRPAAPSPSDNEWVLLKDSDPYRFHFGIDRLAQKHSFDAMKEHVGDADAHVRLGVLLACRRSELREGKALLPAWLSDTDGNVRRAALQWISEERLTEFQPKLEAALAPPLSRQTFMAYLAAIQMLVSNKPDPNATVSQVRQVALDASRPPDLRALALRLLPVNEATISEEALHALIEEKKEAVGTEALRILTNRRDDASQAELRRIASDAQNGVKLRADAISGLTLSAGNPETDRVLAAAIGGEEPILRSEALRAARGHLSLETFQAAAQRAVGTDDAARELREQLLLQARASAPLQALATEKKLSDAVPAHPAPNQPWPEVLAGKGDAAAGRRLFYHPNGPKCYTCHSIEGRGGKVGPDLTQIGKLSPAELLVAIREPSKDIAPAFADWLVKLKDGREVSGIDTFQDNKEEIFLMDATGKQTMYKVADIVSREPLPISMMPPGLDALMTEQEMRDLLAFLREGRD